jgi:hypothetical protein
MEVVSAGASAGKEINEVGLLQLHAK